MSAMEALRSSHRSTMTAILTSKPERLETGNGFDDLPSSEDLVSVIVPSYAHEEFVEQALRSVTGQTYRNIEVILIDDESPDRTFELALGVLRTSALPYCAIRRRKSGMDINLNAGILLSHGGWIAFLASDDFFPRNNIEVLLTAARANRADIAVGPVDDVTRDGSFKASRAAVVARFHSLSADAFRKALLEQHGSLMIQGMLLSRRVFASVGLYTPELVASDFDLLIRMASQNLKFAFVPEITAFHRQTRHALSREHIQRSLQSHLAIASRHARSFGEYRVAASTVLCEAGLNHFHYRYYTDTVTCFGRAFALAPFNTCRILAKRIASRLSK